ncbi:MAG: FAD-dependent oxidoreductase, partial [Thioalkalivibrio sp.]|nr:FAD-dependent oxidoreductase [Thioalkalivibrio sp.]
MSQTKTIEVPDIGDFKDVEIIEVLVQAGSEIAPEDPLITLESDKASIDVPAPEAGTVRALHVQVGDRVSRGDPMLDLETRDAAASPAGGSDDAESGPESGSAESSTTEKAAAPQAAPQAAADPDTDSQCQVLVLGSGPGGYSAAFRAADLGLDVVMVERYPEIGGVCLNVGCIPSKALLHAGEVLHEAERFAALGIQFGKPEIDLDGLRGYKDGTVGKLTGGLKQLARQRKVRVVSSL